MIIIVIVMIAKTKREGESVCLLSSSSLSSAFQTFSVI